MAAMGMIGVGWSMISRVEVFERDTRRRIFQGWIFQNFWKWARVKTLGTARCKVLEKFLGVCAEDFPSNVLGMLGWFRPIVMGRQKSVQAQKFPYFCAGLSVFGTLRPTKLYC